MNQMSVNYYGCQDIIDAFGEEKIEKRFSTVFKEMLKFLEINGLEENAFVNKILLANAVGDYFSDIMRLKDYHIDIEKANSEKVIAYSAYWILHRKPLQALDSVPDGTGVQEFATLNERFVLQYILDYLSERERESHILLRESKGLQNFAALMLYYLIYRKCDAQALEMIITAFMAGQIYERIDKDIARELHPYDRYVPGKRQ